MIDILFENNDVLVVHKPAGMLVHPAPNTDEKTLIDFVLENHPEIAEVGEEGQRAGLVHRLDRQVSGVIAIAKTQEMFDHLKKQFQERTVEKEYLGIVYGQVSQDTGTIDFNIARSRKTGMWVARPKSQEGREALTTYDVLARYKTATYLSIRIHTGRTHQIRLHMKALDHPIIGDELYGKKQMKNIKKINLDRLALHAHKLAFIGLDGERIEVSSPFPEELETILSKLPSL